MKFNTAPKEAVALFVMVTSPVTVTEAASLGDTPYNVNWVPLFVTVALFCKTMAPELAVKLALALLVMLDLIIRSAVLVTVALEEMLRL